MLIRIFLVLITALGMGAGSPLSKPALSAAPRPAIQESPESFNVEFFPVAPHHVGDHLSVRVTYSGEVDVSGQEMTIALADQPDQVLETATFSQRSKQAVFYWIADTEDRKPSFINFLLKVPVMDLSWQTGVNLLPTPDEQPQNWAEIHTNCCTIHYINGTDAQEDIIEIQQILETQTTEALEQFKSKIDPGQTPLEEGLSFVLIPIVIGQGGFATDFAVVTYSDRNWAGTDFSHIAHHEIVHVLDRSLNDGPRPSLFAEGLAVFFAEGHYRQGDPLERAAALLAIDRYISITDFVDNFYAAQHEISYLEAAGLVAYLSEIWGREEFLDFYFNLPEADRDSESISSALEEEYDLNLAELENEYVTYLRSINPGPEVQDNVRLTIEIYDMMRRYQQIRIPSAYFRNAWWPPMDRALEKEIAGDYAPREKAPAELIIENLFLEIYPALDAGEYQFVQDQLHEIEQLLDLAEDHGKAFSHYSIGWPILKFPAVPLKP